MSEEKEDQDVPVNTRTIRKHQCYAEMRKVNGNTFTEVLQRAKGKFHFDKGDLQFVTQIWPDVLTKSVKKG